MLLLRLQAADKVDRNCLEAEAELYLIGKQYDKAINSYLEMEGERVRIGSDAGAIYSANDARNFSYESSNNGRLEDLVSGTDTAKSGKFFHIYDMIERENLFEMVKEKLINLVRLSRIHAEAFLARNIDKISIPSVVKQLKSDRKLLHWYLDLIFKRCFELYNSPEYAEYHTMQISLYAEFTPNKLRFQSNKTKSSENYSDQDEVEEIKPFCRSGFELIRNNDNNSESDFIKFLKGSAYASLELALKESEKRKPPLFREMVYILAKMGAPRDALRLLLREIGDAYDAISFIEANDKSLWGDLLDYGLENPKFLSQLLDFVGVCEVDPVELLRRIPPKLKLPHLRYKLQQILSQFDFKVFMNDICNDILDEDAQNLLRQLNQQRRKAIRISPSELRCVVCSRPLYLPHGQTPSDVIYNETIKRMRSKDLQVFCEL
jgi:hypothetical protein